MVKEFTKNMFVMLFAIMIGVIIITYFIGDIINRSKIDILNAEHKEEIITLKGLSENFTSHFLKSSGVLDQAREDRAFGNYHFDLGLLWYQSALSQKNTSMTELYKMRGIDNCTDALPNYLNSNYNFLESKDYFNETKAFVSYKKYIDLFYFLFTNPIRLCNSLFVKNAFFFEYWSFTFISLYSLLQNWK